MTDWFMPPVNHLHAPTKRMALPGAIPMNNIALSKDARETGPTSQPRTARSRWALMAAMYAATASKGISR